MRCHRHIQRAVAGGQQIAQFGQGRFTVGATVHQHLASVRRDDEDRIALSNIQRIHVQPAIGVGRRQPADQQ